MKKHKQSLAEAYPNGLIGDPKPVKPLDVTYPDDLNSERSFDDYANLPREEISKVISNENNDMLLKLLDFYNINSSDPNQWLRLANALANDHVQGFRFECEKNRGGRPKSKSTTDAYDFYHKVNDILKTKNLNISQAISFVVDNNLCPKYTKGNSKKSLYARYMGIKKQLKNLQSSHSKPSPVQDFLTGK